MKQEILLKEYSKTYRPPWITPPPHFFPTPILKYSFFKFSLNYKNGLKISA